MGRGGILQEEVEAAAGNTDEDEHQLILPRQPHGFWGRRGPQGQVRKTHAQGNDLMGGKGPHNLGQHKAAAPDQRGVNRAKACPHELLIFGKAVCLFLRLGFCESKNTHLYWLSRFYSGRAGKRGRSSSPVHHLGDGLWMVFTESVIRRHDPQHLPGGVAGHHVVAPLPAWLKLVNVPVKSRPTASSSPGTISGHRILVMKVVGQGLQQHPDSP